MREAEVEHLAERVVSTLSGGERLRVMLARLFATQPSIILADEPIAALDPYHQLHTMELLRQHCDRGGAAAVVLHDLSMAARFCQRLVLMHNGTVAADGEPAQVLSDDNLRDVYGIAAKRVCDEEGVAVVPSRRVQDQHPE
jgi:iron complex transport system ATP-binding protein